jgi:hypothetical protein
MPRAARKRAKTAWKRNPRFASKWGRLHEQNDTDALEVDKSRRRVSHFFGAIADLYEDRLLSKPMARRFANYSGADLWFDVVEPMEEELGRDYNRSQFDTLRELRDCAGRQQPRWFKPEITKENVTAGEVEAIHRALCQLRQEMSALTVRVDMIEARQKADH